MKLWTAEQTARRMTVFLVLYGVLMTGAGIALCITESRSPRGVDPRAIFWSILNSATLLLAVGMALYLRIRGRKGVIALRACCVASAAIEVAVGLLAGDAFGSLIWVLVTPMLALSALACALVMRRLERGDPSPLMPGAENLLMTRKEIILMYLALVVIGVLVYIVLGGSPFPDRSWKKPEPAPEPPAWGADDIAESDWSVDLEF